jgi:hypothetical protein
LAQHVQIHNGDKPHECDICQLRFSRSYHLERHKITHTRERDCQPSICIDTFSTSSDCTKTDTEEKPNNDDLSDSFPLERCKIGHTGEKDDQSDGSMDEFSTLTNKVSPSMTEDKPNIDNLSWNKTARHQLKKESPNKHQVLCISCGKDVIESQDMLTEDGIEIDHSFQCKFCQEPERREPVDIGYVCSLCSICFDAAQELENHLSTHIITD